MRNIDLIKRIKRLRFRFLLLAALGVPFGMVARAENIIDANTVQDGGTFANGTVTNNPLIISGEANPTLNLKNGATTAPVNAAGAVRGMVVGTGGNSGKLLIEGGSTFNNNGPPSQSAGTFDGVPIARGNSYLGLVAGSTGEVTVTGAGSTFINTASAGSNTNANLHVGYGGIGKLTILNGGTASNFAAFVGELAGASGEVIVSGAGSTWANGGSLNIGDGGTGKLTISNGGVVTSVVSSGSTSIGNAAGSSGEVIVTGLGSSWTPSNGFSVGNSGNGKLTVTDGAQVIGGYAAAFRIGNAAGSVGEATVSGAGSTWTGSLGVGYGGSGKLTVEAGGAFTGDGYLYLGYSAGSDAEVLVTGNGSLLSSGTQVTIGRSGIGKLSITEGGVANATSTTVLQYIGQLAGSSGEVLVSGTGSSWNVASELVVGNLGTGKLTVADGGLVAVRTLIASSGDLFGNGTISAKGAVLDGVNLLFDATHGLTQSISLSSGGTLNLNVDGTGYLGAGHKGTGSMTIADGITAASTQGHLGYQVGSNGTATVTGNGSAWNNSDALYVGNAGTGTLNVTAGGAVSNTIGYIGNSTGSSGAVVVDGNGSTWTNSAELYVGNNGTGSLTVQNGGSVSARTLFASLSDLHGNGTISANGAVLDANLQLDATHGVNQTVAFGSGGSLNLNVDGTGYLGAGNKGTGTLTIAEGVTATSTQGIVGNLAGSNGTATVTGAGSKWTNAGSLVVGNFGAGKLEITNGGTVSNTTANLGARSGSSGEALVSGTGSTWATSGQLTVGGGSGGTATASGKLSVEAGGTVTNADGVVGGSGGRGEVLVTGTGSTWANSGMLTIGSTGGSGTLTIAAGGSVVNTESRVSTLSSSIGQVLVTGADSTWTNSGPLTIGYAGPGTMTIENGATVTNTTGTIARGTNVVADVLVRGAGSTWRNTDNLILGGQSLTSQGSNNTATLTVADGGTVEVGGTLKTFTGDTVNLQSGGTIKTNHYLISNTNGHAGSLNWTGGTLSITGNLSIGPTTSNLLTVPELGKLTGTGTVAGAVDAAGTITIPGSVTNAGIVAPGNSPGTMTISGNYTQLDTGILEIELGGLTAGTLYDQLVVSGNAALNGSLVVSLLDGFTLEDGQIFTILTASNITGQFAGLNDRAIVDTFGGFDLVVNYSATSVQLSAISAVPEPTSLALVATVMAGAVGYRRRRKKVNEVLEETDGEKRTNPL